MTKYNTILAVADSKKMEKDRKSEYPFYTNDYLNAQIKLWEKYKAVYEKKAYKTVAKQEIAKKEIDMSNECIIAYRNRLV